MSDFIAVCFDIRDPKRLRRVSDALENFGIRVQRSLFECRLDENQLQELQDRIETLMDLKEDQVRYYPLCPKDVPKIIIDGIGFRTRDWDYFIS
jgi:CRISPR-associated protein Cas2